jgi:AraC-like DNA-binding protein
VSYGPQAQLEREYAIREQADTNIHRLLENRYAKSVESETHMTTRLRKNRTRFGLREVRHRLNGLRHEEARASSEYRLYDAIYRAWKKSRAGFQGVAITEKTLAKRVGVSERHVQRLIPQLEGAGLLVCLRSSGGVTSYAPIIPEVSRFQDATLEAFDLDLKRQKATMGPAECREVFRTCPHDGTHQQLPIAA